MIKWLTENTLLEIPLWHWAMAAALAAVSFVCMLLALKYIEARLRKTSLRTPTLAADLKVSLVASTSRTLLAFASIIIGTGSLNLSGNWMTTIMHLWFMVLAIQIGFWIDHALRIWRNHDSLTRWVSNPVMGTMLLFLLKASVWTIVVLSILANAGINITALIASLGIGGVAIALAVQTVLGDLFASISIGVDKPFEIGDFIVVDDISGSIEHIGLRSTRIRSLNGEQVVCSNTDLLKHTIRNYKRMKERRVIFHFNLSYNTPVDRVERIPAMIKEIVSAHPTTRFDRAHFFNLGRAALEFEVVYFVLDADYNRYMDIQQSINIKIMKKIAELEANFALPDGRTGFQVAVLPTGYPDTSPEKQKTYNQKVI